MMWRWCMRDSVIFKQGSIVAGVFFLSAALLALEVLYVRLVSILLFPVATYLVISLALLGLGASGGYLSIRASRYRLEHAAMSCIGFAVAVLVSLPFIWFAGRNSNVAVALPFVLTLPMFFGGFALALVFTVSNVRLPVIYFADMLGAGISAGMIMVGLFYLTGMQVAVLIAGLGLVSALFFSPIQRQMFGVLALVGVFGSLFVMSARLPYGITPISPKELKLMSALDDGVRWEYQGWSPLARVDVLSLDGDVLSPKLPIPYKLVTHDGGAPTLLLGELNKDTKRQLIDNTVFGVPYWLLEQPSVLIIGLGGGPDVVAALAGEAARVQGAEVNPRMVAIVRDYFADFAGRPYDDPRVHIKLVDGRHLLATSEARYDLIQLTGVDTSVASLGANPNMAENYLYTREAFTQYLLHLSEDGLLSVSFPNVDGLGLRLLALSLQAMAELGIPPQESPQHIVISEMTGYVHLLVKRSPFTAKEIAILKEHYARQPTSVYFPLYNRLFGVPDDEFIAESRILLAPGESGDTRYSGLIAAFAAGKEADFYKEQPFTIVPPTDDRPFFFVLDKWGYQSANLDALLLALVFLFLFSVLLAILPVFLLERRGLTSPRPGLTALYFACLGLGFIFIEVTLIQKLGLILGHPSYALAVTLCALLVGSGLGSISSDRVEMPFSRKARLAARGVAALAVLSYLLLTMKGDAILVQPLSVRMLVAFVLVSLQGFLMGIPFPSGLAAVKLTGPSFVPWAWGINAVFTVIGTMLALLLALHFGYGSVLGVAAVLYLIASVTTPRV
ncbi:MAG: hypothetical protein D6803_08880 [Anaerolineae bacterium]|nr:MAG: hypothetical protein D6803_08880 [Anaerolineae bacterium]